VKNSWGTIATNDQFIKAKPKLMHGFMRALLKALRLVKQNREVAMDTMLKFSESDRELAATLIQTFNRFFKRFERLERSAAVEPFDRLRAGFWNGSALLRWNDWNV